MRELPSGAPSGASCTSGALGQCARAALGVALKLAYPIVLLAAWRTGSARWAGLALFALLWVQRWLGAGSLARLLARLSALEWIVAGALSCASAAIALTGSEPLLRFYPVLVNAGMLAVFGATLAGGGPSMIEKFARMRKPDLGARAVRYTRGVTQVWCGFFAANGATAAALAWYGSRAQWALYNGVIAYALIGLLIVGEIAWRRMFVPHDDGREMA
ncbi:hypothetical protein C9I57_11730 [Trinickia symbiotica]|uniref:DNA gyrase subunit B n=1 Tax=Trinickia symbiotica TaxID=863227 RepID=A0A2T3XVG0_9BURK|nr:hypothetical protein [Trinickia symbiotica]PTB20513.1 hypothetical protein C9I57_11730 [Trinickia symbiotica]